MAGREETVWRPRRHSRGRRWRSGPRCGHMLCVCGERWTEAVNHLGVSASVSVRREELAEGTGRFRDSSHK